MGFVDAVKSGLRNRMNFSGRSTRSEFWFWNLFVVLFAIALLFIWVHIVDRFFPRIVAELFFLSVLLLILGTTLPGFALLARRLHDLGRTGWWGLIFIVPFLGQIVFVVLMLLRGTRGPNPFGDDPLASTPLVATAA